MKPAGRRLQVAWKSHPLQEGDSFLPTTTPKPLLKALEFLFHLYSTSPAALPRPTPRGLTSFSFPPTGSRGLRPTVAQPRWLPSKRSPDANDGTGQLSLFSWFSPMLPFLLRIEAGRRGGEQSLKHQLLQLVDVFLTDSTHISTHPDACFT